jgi:hypothetical protein
MALIAQNCGESRMISEYWMGKNADGRGYGKVLCFVPTVCVK